MTANRSLSIVKALHEAGHTAYYAGGYVRDCLLGILSHEVDIATSASPEEVQRLFPKTIPVGISFGVVIVVIDNESFEVATFRKDHSYDDGRHPNGVDFSSAEEDARRRDFTINGLFFDPLTEEILDFVDGKRDLKQRIIRAIGNAEERFTEDRLRMIRAVRFATNLGFRIEESTRKAIEHHASTLFPSVSMERIWQEFGKMRHMDQAVIMLHRFGLLQTIFPELAEAPLSLIEERVEPFSRFPQETPTILYLREVLPDTNDLVRYMRASRQDQHLLDYFDTTCADLYDWVQFYKEEKHALYLAIEEAKGRSIEEHRNRLALLRPHIERERPVIDATTLIKRGIKPGPEMGRLLREGERLAINEGLSKEELLRRLLSHS